MKLSPSLVNVSLILTECLNSIIHNSTTPTDLIVLVSDRSDVNTTVMRINHMKDEQSFFLNVPIASLYVVENIVDEEMQDVWEFIVGLHRSVYNPYAKFLFIAERFSVWSLTFIRRYFSSNALFITTGTEVIYSFSPQIYGKWNVKDPKLMKIGQCVKDFGEHKEYFHLEHRQNWTEHEVSVGYLKELPFTASMHTDKKGFEIEIYKIILDNLKVKYKFTEIFNGRSYINHGFVFGAIPVTDSICHDRTPSYVEDYMKFFVPSTPKIDRWRYILLVFDPDSWTFCILGLLGILIAFIFMKFFKRLPVDIGITQFIFLMFSGRTKLFRSTYIAIEQLIFCMIFWSFMVNNLFCSRLTFMLNGINYEKRVESLEDMVKSKLIIGAYNNFFVSTVQDMPEFRNYSSLKLCDPMVDCYKRIILHKDLVMFHASIGTRLDMQEIVDPKTGTSYLRELKESYFTNRYGGLLKQGVSIFPIVKKKMQYLIESGITERIVKKYEIPFWADPVLEPIRSLKFEHIVAPLILLAVGLTLSIIAFLYEVHF